MQQFRDRLIDLKSWRIAWLCAVAMTLPATADPIDRLACDEFCHLTEANKASLVMLLEQQLVDRETARVLAVAIAKHAEAASTDLRLRSGNYLDFERALSADIGADASRLHIGRSRQDLHETVRRLQQRDAFFAVFDALSETRAAMLGLADRTAAIVIPAYTHGVQAQPTSAGQYFLAFSAALARDAERLKEFYPRLNRSPLGAAVLGTSGFALDRDRLAELLGFEQPVDNAYDATLISSFDSKLEFAQILSISALQTGQFIENLHTQYHDPNPWMRLGDGQTSGSSIMPQKKNPRPLDRIRSSANAVVAASQRQVLAGHNVNTGMNDYRALDALLDMTEAALSMYDQQRQILDGLVISEARALAELEADYSTMTEVADVLVREVGLPFREAYSYASALTERGRAEGLAPLALSDDALRAIYADSVGEPLPLSPERIRAAMNPSRMVADRRGRGGPQAEEVMRMLEAARASLAADRSWAEARRGAIDTADNDRQRAFDALLD